MFNLFMFPRNKIQNDVCRLCFLPTTMQWVNVTCHWKLLSLNSTYWEHSSPLHMAYSCIIINLDGLGYLNHSDSRPGPKWFTTCLKPLPQIHTLMELDSYISNYMIQVLIGMFGATIFGFFFSSRVD